MTTAVYWGKRYKIGQETKSKRKRTKQEKNVFNIFGG